MSGYTVSNAVDTLVEGLRDLDGRITEAEADLARLREDRRKLQGAVKLLRPDALPSTNGSGKKKPTPNYVSEDSIARTRSAIAPWGGPFTASDLLHDTTYTGPAEGTLKRALQALHDNGELRLVRQKRGGQKVYEVIR